MRAVEVMNLLMAIAALSALGLTFLQRSRRAAAWVSSMAPMAKLFLVCMVFLSLSDYAMADTRPTDNVGSIIVGTLVWTPLLALVLAFFPSKRRGAVWVSSIALALSFSLLGWVMYEEPANRVFLALSTLPANISLIALNLGLRGSAPPSKTSKSVLVLLLVAPVAIFAAYLILH
jgi:hypothetical protein